MSGDRGEAAGERVEGRICSVPTGRLMDWLEGRLGPEEAEEVAVLVARAQAGEDPSLAERAAWCRQFLRHAAQAVVEDPPRTARIAVLQAFANRGASLDPGPSLVHTAEVVFDSRRDLTGVRSGAASTSWSLVLSAPGVDVAVDVAARGPTARLGGQVLPLGRGPAGHVVLRAGDAVAARDEADTHGLFSLGNHPPGPYVLTVEMGAATVRCPLELRW